MIETAEEMNSVNEALNTIRSNTTVNYWIVPPRQDGYTKWGYCEPGKKTY